MIRRGSSTQCVFGGEVVEVVGRRGGGEAYSFVACLSHLTIDHASLPRRSTVPTPNRHLQQLGAHYASSTYHIEMVLLILSPSCFAVCGHHLPPRIAIVFSLLSSLPNSSMSQESNFLIYSSNASRSSLHISRSPTM